MCGQAGLLLGASDRTRDEINHLTRLFTSVLELSEERGPFATGVAWVRRDGDHRIVKQAVPASEFICDAAFQQIIAEVNDNVSLLVGHTRWPTRGNIQNIANSQPKRAGVIVATHNGTITNADWLFRRFSLPRHAEVDSEVIFRFADEAIAPDGRLDIYRLAGRLALCRGSLASVMIAKTDPGRVVMIKNGNPLELTYHAQYKVLLYASNLDYIKRAIGSERGWIKLVIPRNTLTVIDTDALEIAEIIPVIREGSSALCRR